MDDVEGKKAVFRPVLSSPYHVAWPSLAPVHATPILHTLLALLASDEVKGILQREGKDAAKDEVAEGEAKQAASESAARRERRKKLKERLAAKKSATGKSATAKPIEPEFTSASASISPLIIGLNSITRHLEGLIRTSLQGGSSPTPAAAASGQLLLFICKGDLDPASLALHIPLLVCAYNATCSPTSAPGRSAALSLIALPANSELAISTSLAVRRCSSLLLDSSHTTLEKHAYTHALRARLEEACLAPLRAPWLEAASASALSSTAPWALPQPRPAHTAPRITHLRTSAPADMFTAKGAKKARRGERSTVRKERRDEGQREDKRGKMIQDAAKRRGRAKAGVQRRKEDRRKVESEGGRHFERGRRVLSSSILQQS